MTTSHAARRTALAALALLVLLVSPRPARAQGAAGARPALAAGADTNDWQAYYDEGVRELRSERARARASFAWAARLDPSRAEPMLAQWVAYWSEHPLLRQYMRGEPTAYDAPGALAADSARLRALWRNPFVPQSLAFVLDDEVADERGEWSLSDDATQAWLAYVKGDMRRASAMFARAASRARGRPDLRVLQASAHVAAGQLPEARAALAALLADYDGREAGTLVRDFGGKDFAYYGDGLLRQALGDTAGARASFEQALAANVALAPAHAALGRIAQASGNAAGAVAEYAQAVELDGGDAVLWREYGGALVAAGRAAEAVPALRTAVRLAPDYAEPRYVLAVVLDATGQREAAAAEYDGFVARAPRGAAERVAQARERMALLGTAR